jgi:hypothetical protein
MVRARQAATGSTPAGSTARARLSKETPGSGASSAREPSSFADEGVRSLRSRRVLALRVDSRRLHGRRPDLDSWTGDFLCPALAPSHPPPRLAARSGRGLGCGPPAADPRLLASLGSSPFGASRRVACHPHLESRPSGLERRGISTRASLSSVLDLGVPRSPSWRHTVPGRFAPGMPRCGCGSKPKSGKAILVAKKSVQFPASLVVGRHCLQRF